MIYNYPEYYELAFSFRDIPSEAAFLRQAMLTHSEISVARVLEIAAGPAPHAGALTESGLHYTGLDNNPNMIDYATRKWHYLSPPPRFLRADMASFTLPEPVDFVFVLLGSLYVNTPERLTSHFDSVAETLRPGGLYLLDLCLEYGDPLVTNVGRHVVSHHRGVTVDSRFDITPLDPTRNLYEERWRLSVEKDGERREFETVEQNTALFPDDFERFIKSHRRFEMVGSWAHWDFGRPIEAGFEPERPFTLIRRI